MSELDGAAQLLRVEIDGMKYAFSAAGIAGIGLIKAFAKFIKFLGSEGEKHRFKKLDALAGEASLADFKEKYRGEDVELFELKDYDADAFIDMCKSEGIAVVKLPDLNGDDGKCQFMAAGSAGPMIRHNIERLTQWHMEHRRDAKYLKGEVPGFAFAEYASGRKTKELKALTVRDGHSSAEFIEACKQAGIPAMRETGSDRKFIVTKEDFKSKAFLKRCSRYADEGYISFTEELKERISNGELESKSGEAINGTDYAMSAKGNTAEEKQANFKAMADEGMPDEGISYEDISYEGMPDEGISYEDIPDEGISYKGMPDEGISYEGIPYEGIPYEQLNKVELSGNGEVKDLPVNAKESQKAAMNKSGAKYMKGEAPGFAFAEYASGREAKELKALTLKDGPSGAEFIEACVQAGILAMRDMGSDRRFIVTKEDFQSKAFSKHCLRYVDEGYISFTEEFKERLSNMEFKSGEAINATDYVMSAKGDTAEEKQANFKAMADERIPDESLNKVELSGNGEVEKLLSNAKKSQKVAMFEALHYQPFQINENECIGENDRSLSLFVNGEQFEVDKELVVSAGGRSVFYCPRDSENSRIGNVTCKGKKVDADMFRAHLSEAGRPNAAKAAADLAKKMAGHAFGFSALKPSAKK